jgi:hypothetical protein
MERKLGRILSHHTRFVTFVSFVVSPGGRNRTMVPMMRQPIALLVSSLFAVALVSAQSQGIVMVQQETRDGKVTTNTMQMDKTHMRMESGGTTVVIFDGDAQVMRVINMEKKSYTEMTKAQLQQMSQQMSAAMEKLKNLPPEQRAMMEKMMAGRGAGMPGMAPAAPITYRGTGSDKTGKWACAKYDGTREQQKVVELCTVEAGALGLTPADFEVAKQLAEFLKTLMPTLADEVTLNGSTAEQGFSGIPIRRTSLSNGQVRSTSELKDIRREAIPASAWQVPAGFKRENR